ncbi:MAG: right-handed parallel beta-helix repeat-containing protein, partial [Pseudomonadota bacterium]
GAWCKATSPSAVSSCAEQPSGALFCQSAYALRGSLECKEKGRDLWCRADQLAPKGDDAARLESYIIRHAQPVGAENQGWQVAAGGTRLEEILHARTARGAGLLTGPASGVRVTAGDVRLDGNVIVGTRTAVSFTSDHNAYIKGAMTNNVIIGNGVGIAAAGGAADLLLTRNTIRYNAGDGVNADVYDGVKIIANEITGNENGIFLSEKVRMATVSSNLVAKNFSDAMRVSSGFFGAVGGNTFAENGGCTIQFFSAEQKILNNADIKVTAFRDFTPQVVYEGTNYAVGNSGDAKMGKIKKSRRDDERAPAAQFASCNAPL